QLNADKAIEDLVTGKSKNIHETMIALGKAELAFKLTMQVRNKVMEAYKEITSTTV
ncbi:Flagellar hook-basal body complex protein FliE, partial [hydrothermal vent metagenome]